MLIKLNTVCLFFCAATLPLAGYIADKIGHYRLMFFSATATLFYAVPFFILMKSSSIFVILLTELFLLAFSQGFVAPLNAFIAKLFPAHVRCTGMTLGYCVGMGIFGGGTPYIMANLVQSGNIVGPGTYLMIITLIGLLSIVFAKRLMIKV